MCFEGLAGPFVGIRIKKQTKLNNAELKVRADTRTAAPLDPPPFFQGNAQKSRSVAPWHGTAFWPGSGEHSNELWSNRFHIKCGGY